MTVRFRRNGALLHAIGGRGIDLDGLSARVAVRLENALPPQVTVRVRPIRPSDVPALATSEAEPLASLHFSMGRTEALRLGGFMLDEPVVTIRGEAWTLGSLADLGAIDVDPGPVTVRVILPWGTWSKRVRARSGRSTSVELPRRIGDPPLRVTRLRGRVAYDQSHQMEAAGPPRSVLTADEDHVPRFLGANGSALGRRAMDPSAVFGGSMWRPGEHSPDWRSVAEVRTSRGALRFPLSEVGPVAVRLGAAPRAEPLSLLPSPAWDQLVASGRLDETAAQQAVDLTNEKWADPVLGVAGAYGCLSHRMHDYLEVVLTTSATCTRSSPDLAVLHGALDRQIGRRRPDARQALERLHEEAACPVLRWGVTLGQLAAEHYDLPDLGLRLGSLEQDLAPASTWTLWHVRKTPDD